MLHLASEIESYVCSYAKQNRNQTYQHFGGEQTRLVPFLQLFRAARSLNLRMIIQGHGLNLTKTVSE